MEYTPASAGNPPQTYRVEDVASILGISRKSAYNLTREGYFRVVRIGSTIRSPKNPSTTGSIIKRRRFKLASIIKRGKSYCVVYDYVNSDGQRKQKWETFPSRKEASVRKSEVELAQKKGTFLPPSAETVAEFMDEFVRLYGELKWSPSMYDSSTGIIRNYINPLIGDLPMQSVTVKTVDIFIHDLHRTRSAAEKYHAVKQDYISDSQVEKVFKLARCAFNQAVRWNVIPQNPFNQANLCKAKCREREIWDAETIRKALDACRDANLYVCMNLSFACSLRIGEILGLTWNNVHISEQEIKDDNAWLYITQELARVKRSALAALNNKNIYHIFPAWTGKTTSTVLVLKKPKTDSSIRRVWIPKTVAYVLQELRKNQLHQIELAGFDYTDYKLVIAFPNGHPCEEKRINQAFTKLKAEAKLPDVVFHSLRHSSATYKLKLNHGDLKATQGDTGHAEIDMLTKVYAHILDSDRKITAQRFEEAFYQPQDSPEQKDNSSSSPDIAALIAQIQQYPELGKILSDVLAKQASTDENTENGNGNLSDSE